MQRILNALLQFRNPILYFFLLGLSIAFSFNQSPFHQYTIEKYGFYFSAKIYEIKDGLSHYFTLKKVNQQLLEENKQLKSRELTSPLIPLYPEALEKPKRFPFKVKKANVLKNSFNNQRNFLTLDMGSKQGIQPEMGVISKNGIVGVVHSVTPNYSNVISLLHQDLKINVRTNKSPAFGSLVWSGKDPTKFLIEDVVSNANISVGDTIVTGGMSSYFPLGIPVGKVTKLEKIQGSGYYSIEASLLNDLSQLYYVYILENIDFQELQSLKKKLPQ
jgi:rod shape-determining protein MreC